MVVGVVAVAISSRFICPFGGKGETVIDLFCSLFAFVLAVTIGVRHCDIFVTNRHGTTM